MKTRLTQLLMRYVGVILVTKFGYDMAHAQSVVNELVIGILALICFIIDHYCHGSVLANAVSTFLKGELNETKTNSGSCSQFDNRLHDSSDSTNKDGN